MFKKIGDMFLDQQGGVDEKRILGSAMLIFACVYIAAIKPGDIAGFGAIAAVGGGLVGIAAPLADQGKLGGP